jgi:hypothetical protein
MGAENVLTDCTLKIECAPLNKYAVSVFGSFFSLSHETRATLQIPMAQKKNQNSGSLKCEIQWISLQRQINSSSPKGIQRTSLRQKVDFNF